MNTQTPSLLSLKALDLVSVGFLPWDITIKLRPADTKAQVLRAFQQWVDSGSRFKELPAVCSAARIENSQVVSSPGGSAANVARVVRCWGWSAMIAGVIGQDDAADAILQADRATGLPRSLVTQQMGKATPIFLVLNRDGKSEIKPLVPRSKRVRSLFQSDKDIMQFSEQLQHWCPRVLHTNKINGILPRIIAGLPNTRLSFALDGPPERAEKGYAVELMLKHTHLLTLPDDCVEAWLEYFAPLSLPSDAEGRCAALLEIFFQLSSALELAVMTRSEKGLVAKRRGHAPVALPAFAPINVVDPTGSGDTFLGVLQALLVKNNWDTKGLPADIVPLLAEASVAAALNCERPSASGRIPTSQEVEARLKAVKVATAPRIISVAPALPSGVATATGPLSRLIAGIPAAVKATLGKNEFRALIDDFERTQTLTVVGSGSSQSVALCVQRLVRHLMPTAYTATALHPLEYLRLARTGETVLLISQGGNPDIQAACARARQVGIEPFLITASDGKWAKSFRAGHLLRHVGEPVRSFVNVRGPSAALALIIEWLSQQSRQPAPSFLDYEQRYQQALLGVADLAIPPAASDRSFVALATGLMLGPLHEIDLKAAEAALELESYELKGWTHGRYQRVWARRNHRPQAFFTLETAADAPMVEELAKRFNVSRTSEHFRFYRLLATPDPLGLWQHLVHVMLIIQRISPNDPATLTVPSNLTGINYGIPIAGLEAEIRVPPRELSMLAAAFIKNAPGEAVSTPLL